MHNVCMYCVYVVWTNDHLVFHLFTLMISKTILLTSNKNFPSFILDQQHVLIRKHCVPAQYFDTKMSSVTLKQPI